MPETCSLICSASAEAEEQAGKQNPTRAPPAEDDSRQRDEAAARDNAVGVGARVTGRQIRAADPGQSAADDAREVLDPDDVDAERRGRLRMLADGLIAQARARPAEEDGSEDDKQQRSDRPSGSGQKGGLR